MQPAELARRMCRVEEVVGWREELKPNAEEEGRQDKVSSSSEDLEEGGRWDSWRTRSPDDRESGEGGTGHQGK